MGRGGLPDLLQYYNGGGPGGGFIYRRVILKAIKINVIAVLRGKNFVEEAEK